MKSDLVSLKTKADKLDIEKLLPVPFDLSKLSLTTCKKWCS